VRNTPGLSFRPIVNMVGFHDLNETFFDDARLPANALLGEENRGWYQATTTLDFERSSVSGTASARRNLEEVVELVDGAPGRDVLRLALADRALEVQVGRWLSWRVVSIQMAGGVPNAEASVAKLFNSEMGQRVARTCIQAAGLAGGLRKGSRRAVLGGHPTMAYMAVIPATIAGGTSEVQRNIIATRGLGLPRG
jgi:alkylation response protein AidB-like acyl-CoA dehydrogenase